MSREAIHDKNDPVIIGVDCARFGDNDTVIFTRIGNDGRSFGFERYNGLDSTQIAERVIDVIQRLNNLGKRVSGLFIDGGGLGAGPVDILRRLGYAPVDVNFGNRASDRKYRRKVDEMWGRMKDGLYSGLALPRDNDLKAQLTQREYSITDTGLIALESKKIMLERVNKSPDIADAIALTYHSDVNRDMPDNLFGYLPKVESEWDPLKIDW